jgi:hypothetical protein
MRSLHEKNSVPYSPALQKEQCPLLSYSPAGNTHKKHG